jgi:phosphate-selective porin OprO/OprP
VIFYERSLPSQIAPNRDIGVQVLGDIDGGLVSYGAAVQNGVPDGASGELDTNDGKDVAGRIAVRPFVAHATSPLSGLTVAIAGTTGKQSGPLAVLHTTSLAQTFVSYGGASADGRLNRVSPQAQFNFKRVWALAEYIHSNVPMRRESVAAEVAHDAWEISGAYLLTAGDMSPERGARPRHNFDFGGGHIGMLQVAARYHTLTVDDAAFVYGLAMAGSTQTAKAWTLGLNWYLSPNFKYVAVYERTDFSGYGAVRPTENALAFRAQVAF